MTPNSDQTIVILGMSDNTSRYSYLAYESLKSNEFNNLIGVTPKEITLIGITIVNNLESITADVHTLTIYVGEKKLEPLITSIISLNPKRIILNPGTENQNLIDQATKAGIEVIEGCTLVMLNTKQF